jgi:hypothetical protein
MVFDETEPVFDESCFQKCDWSEYYPGACEAVPPDAPEVRGQPVSMTVLLMPIMRVVVLQGGLILGI